MPYGILCCGPGTTNNVYDSSDDDDSSNGSDVDALVVTWRARADSSSDVRSAGADAQIFSAATGGNLPTLLPAAQSSVVPPGLRRAGSSGAYEGDQEDSFLDRLAGGWREMQASVVRGVLVFVRE